MNELAQCLIDALEERELVVGANMKIFGSDTQFACSGGEDMTGLLLRAGGYSPTAKVQLVVRKSVLGNISPPTVDQFLTYISTTDAAPEELKVAPTGVNVLWDEIIIIDCVDKNEGA